MTMSFRGFVISMYFEKTPGKHATRISFNHLETSFQAASGGTWTKSSYHIHHQIPFSSISIDPIWTWNYQRPRTRSSFQRPLESLSSAIRRGLLWCMLRWVSLVDRLIALHKINCRAGRKRPIGTFSEAVFPRDANAGIHVQGGQSVG